MKIYIYKMHAGHCGTDDAFTIVGVKPLSYEEEDEYVSEHAHSYGNEQDEDGEWEEGEPEIYLEETVTTKEELLKFSGILCIGSQTKQDLIDDVERDGMVWA